MKLYSYNFVHCQRVFTLEIPYILKVHEIIDLIMKQRKLLPKRNKIVLLNSNCPLLLPYDDQDVILNESFQVRRLPNIASHIIIHKQSETNNRSFFIAPALRRIANVISFANKPSIQPTTKKQKRLISCECCMIHVFCADRVEHSKDYQNWSSAPCSKCIIYN